MAFIRTIVKYGNVVWDNCTQEQSNLLESVQIEVGCIIAGLRCTSSKQIGMENTEREKTQTQTYNHVQNT